MSALQAGTAVRETGQPEVLILDFFIYLQAFFE